MSKRVAALVTATGAVTRGVWTATPPTHLSTPSNDDVGGERLLT